MAGKRKRKLSSRSLSGAGESLHQPAEVKTDVGNTVSSSVSLPPCVGTGVSVHEGETDFPRGGREVLTALERRSIHQQAQQDILFNQDSKFADNVDVEMPTKKKKGRKKSSEVAPGDTLNTDLPSPLHFLSPKKLTPGTLLLGAVREIHTYDITVSLPYNMVGVVSLSDVSDPLLELVKREVEDGSDQEVEEEVRDSKGALSLSKLFRAGQLLPFSVLEKVRTKNLVALTVNPRIVNSNLSASDIRPNMVLSAWISSVEDHGYIVEFGVSGKSGFLLHKNAAEYVSSIGGRCPLQVGQVVLCTVLPGAQARACPVSINPSTVFKALFLSDCLVQLRSLIPGMLVSAAVKQINAPRGILLGFLNGFEGSVSWRHLATKRSSVDKYKMGKKLKARILWIDVSSKTVGLTLQEEIISGIGFSFDQHQVGEIYESSQIVAVDQPIALQLSLTDTLYAYAPIQLVYSSREDKFHKRHSQGSLHSCRIVNFNLLDGVAIVNLQQSVLDKPFMKYSDIPVGSVVEGEISKVMEQGLVVSLSDSISGFCPAVHMSDVALGRSRKKIAVGKKIRCRVLRVDVENRRVIVTLKKCLIKSETPLLASYSQASPGGIHEGTVVSVQHYGLVVRFYGNVRGLVPKSELSSTQIISDPSAMFKIGQVVQCRVLSCDPAAMKLILSLRCETTEPQQATTVNPPLIPGHIVDDLIVTAIDSSGLTLQHPTTQELVLLPAGMLSDYHPFCSVLLSHHSHRLEQATRENQAYSLQHVLIVNGQSPNQPTLASTKKILTEAAKSNSSPSSFSDLKAGMVVPGCIKKHYSYGSFVLFSHSLVGLAPTKYIADEFVSEGSDVFKEWQTVVAKVVELDEEKERFLVSLRCSDLRLSLTNPPEVVEEKVTSQFEDFLQEREHVLQQLQAGGGQSFDKYFKPGEVFKAKVKSVSGDSVHLVLLDGGVVCVASIALQTGSNVPVKGDKVDCCVLDLAYEGTGQLVVSLNPQLIDRPTTQKLETPSKKLKKAQQQQLQPGVQLNATVEHVTPYYVLCTCSTIIGPQLAYGLMDTGQLGVIPQRMMKYLKLGEQVRTVVKSPGSLLWGSNMGLPVVMIQGSAKETARSSLSSSSHVVDHAVGDTVTVTVRDVLETQVNVQCGLWRGRIHFSMATDDLEEGTAALQQLFHTGDVVKARVLRTRGAQSGSVGYASRCGATTLELTTRPSLMSPSVDITEEEADQLLDTSFSPGDETLGVIRRAVSDGLVVSLSTQVMAHVPKLLTSKKLKVIQSYHSKFKNGSVVRCTYVKQPDSSRNRMAVASLIGMPRAPVVGKVVLGQVKRVFAHEGLQVALPGYTGRVDITDISDHYTDSPLKRFCRAQFIRCCMVEVDDDKIDLSLRSSRTGCEDDGEDKDQPVDIEVTGVDQLMEGQVLRGYVTAVTDTGNFVRLGRRVSARVMITNLSDDYVKDYKKLYSVGDLVKGKILKVDYVTKKVEFSLRLSHVDPSKAKKLRKKQRKTAAAGESHEDRDVVSEDSDSDESVAVMWSDEEHEMREEEQGEEEEEEEEEDKMEEDEDEPSPDVGARQLRSLAPSLSISGGFDWNFGLQHSSSNSKTPADSEDEEEEEEEEDVEMAPSKSKRQKRAAKKAEEQHLYQVEHTLLDTSQIPESADDFDRLVVAHPNSSALWVQYMAFCLHTAEVDKARSIAKRALSTISFREEREKLNVWVAWMNLENLYGTQSTLMAVFQDAVQQNEPMEVYLQLVSIYENSDKFNLAEQLYQTIVKRFSSVMKVWVQYGLFLMKRGKTHQARNLLQRSLKSLLKSEHVTVISRFAQFEFKHGEPARGRTMFESILSSYPRRVDIWSVYIDMVVKMEEDLKQARCLFERATTLKLSVQKMKFLLKKFLEFEKLHGTPASIAAVKSRAQTFVESKIT